MRVIEWPERTLDLLICNYNPPRFDDPADTLSYVQQFPPDEQRRYLDILRASERQRIHDSGLFKPKGG